MNAKINDGKEKKGKNDDDRNNNASKDVIIIYLKSDLIKSKENHVVALKIMHDINFVRCDFCTRLHNNNNKNLSKESKQKQNDLMRFGKYLVHANKTHTHATERKKIWKNIFSKNLERRQGRLMQIFWQRFAPCQCNLSLCTHIFFTMLLLCKTERIPCIGCSHCFAISNPRTKTEWKGNWAKTESINRQSKYIYFLMSTHRDWGQISNCKAFGTRKSRV